MNQARHLRYLADAAGADSFEVVRARKHLVVDFAFAGVGPVRITLSSTQSDHRATANQIMTLRRALRERTARKDH